MGGVKPEVVECYVVRSGEGKNFCVPMELMSMLLDRFSFDTCGVHMPMVQITEREVAEQIALEIDGDGRMGLRAQRVRLTVEYLEDGAS